MTRGAAVLLASFLLAACKAPGGSASQPVQVERELRAALAGSGLGPVARGGVVDLLRRAYSARQFAPGWLQHGGCPARALDRLLAAMRGAASHGLQPDEYHLTLLSRRAAAAASGCQERRVTVEDMANLELLASDGLLLLASHLVAGRLDPATLAPRHETGGEEVDLAAVLAEVLRDGQVDEVLEQLQPPNRAYQGLVAALRDLQARGDWPGGSLSSAAPLRAGMSGPGVGALRRRLHASGQLASASGQRYDADLELAVRLAQARHGLPITGVADPQTLAALDRPRSRLMRKVALNLDRWRWLPLELGDPHVLVNAPSFHAELVRRRVPALSMAVIVGRTDLPTPQYSSVIRYLVLNPAWNVPDSIATRDLLPRLAEDPEYLQRRGIRVVQGALPYLASDGEWGNGPVDPMGDDWDAPPEGTLKLRQTPGPGNALGRVKFIFDNPHGVYLHDTPRHQLFALPRRAFSHGCVRLERAVDLALALLSRDPAWTRQRMEASLRGARDARVSLPRPVPVHLTYFTATASPSGDLRLHEDIYSRDSRLEALLSAPR